MIHTLIKIPENYYYMNRDDTSAFQHDNHYNILQILYVYKMQFLLSRFSFYFNRVKVKNPRKSYTSYMQFRSEKTKLTYYIHIIGTCLLFF